MRSILEINLSNACSLHCPYCVAGSVQAFKGSPRTYALVGAVLDYDVIIEWVKLNFAVGDVHSVIISGGEPSILPEWNTVPDALAEAGYETIILTNGSMLKHNAHKLKRKHHILLTWHGEQMPFEDFAEAVNAVKDSHICAAKYVVTPQMVFDKWETRLIKEKLELLGIPVIMSGAEKVMVTNKERIPYITAFNDRFYRNQLDKKHLPMPISGVALHEEDMAIISVRPNGNYGQCHLPLEGDWWGNIYEDKNKARIEPEWRVCKAESGETSCATENTAILMLALGQKISPTIS